MIEYFIPYEQALKLKQLGFPQNDYLSWYGGPDKLTYDQEYNEEDFRDFCCAAPLYQQAFRWFREKYKMAIINPDWNNKFKYKVFNLHLLTQGVLVEEFGFQTYEEAELACLDKLIEIVESKSEQK